MPHPPVGKSYRPRDAAASPLYRIVQDCLETYLTLRGRLGDIPTAACAEASLRSFLECGIPRFGVARFACKDCGRTQFVPFSCKRRMACPSCDAKRAVVESAQAMEELLAEVPYRQWVLVLPKRLRYFVHRNPRLPGEISRMLAVALTHYYRRCARTSSQHAAPAQLHVLQRFGSSVNLHLHDHAVVSDGVFGLEGGVLRFHPVPVPSVEDVARLVADLRRRILKRMQRLGVMSREAVAEMLAWPHGGFSLDGGTSVEASDRAGLERLLLYVLRPALSPTHLTYKPGQDRVSYRPTKGRPDSPRMLEWSGVEFVGRMAALIPPARKHLVRYYGALGPRSPLRRMVTMATRGQVKASELEAGYGVTPAAAVVRAAGTAARAAARGWAVCLNRVFEVYPVQCLKCGTEMKLVAIILQDAQLDRILAHEGMDTRFPKTKPARPPPRQVTAHDEAGQLDPREPLWDGRQDIPND